MARFSIFILKLLLFSSFVLLVDSSTLFTESTTVKDINETTNSVETLNTNSNIALTNLFSTLAKPKTVKVSPDTGNLSTQSVSDKEQLLELIKTELLKLFQKRESEIRQNITECNCMNSNSSDMIDRIISLEHENKLKNDLLSQLANNITEIQTSIISKGNLQNTIQQIQKKMSNTDYSIKDLGSKLTSSKQDFAALLKMVQKTEVDVGTIAGEIVQIVHNQTVRQNDLENELQLKIDEVKKSIHQKDAQCNSGSNATGSDIERRQTEEKVILKTCATKGNNVNETRKIPFNNIKLSHGIMDLSTINNSGIFTCEKKGIYLVTVFITTDTLRGSFNVLRNNDVIADAFVSITGYYETTTITTVTELEVNDTISVSPRHDFLTVFDQNESCLTIVQI